MKNFIERSLYEIIKETGCFTQHCEEGKSPCFPVPYNFVTIQKPAAGGKTGFIPAVELTNIHGKFELRKATDILQPITGETIVAYYERLGKELSRKDSLGETIL